MVYSSSACSETQNECRMKTISLVNPQLKVKKNLTTATLIYTVFCQWYTLCFLSVIYNIVKAVKSIHTAKRTQQLWLSVIHTVFSVSDTHCFLSVIHTVFSVSDLQHSEGCQVNPHGQVNTATLIVCDTHCVFCQWYTLFSVNDTHTVFSISDLQHSEGCQVNPHCQVNTATLIVCDTHCVFCQWYTLSFLSLIYNISKKVKSIHNSKWTQWHWLSVIYTVFSVSDLGQSEGSHVNPQFKVNRVILIVCGIHCVFCQWFTTTQRQSSQSTIQCEHSDRDYLGSTLCL